MCSCGNKTVIKFKNGCCSNDCSCVSTVNNINFVIPDGGEDGQVLAKNGDNLIWVDNEGGGSGTVDFDNITTTISSNGQTIFTNIIPEDKNLFMLFINGIRYYQTTDFTISGKTITWLNTAGLTLQTTDNFTITVL